LILILPLILGCVTSRGDLFDTVTAPAPKKTAEAEGEEVQEYYDDSVDEADEYTPGIEIETRPSEASVYFDRIYRGRSTVFIDNPATGEYVVRITRDGYYPVEDRIHFEEGSYLLLTYHLREITGFLDISVRPEQAEVFIDGDSVDRMPVELRTGPHSVRVERFGYRTWTGTVTVLENETTGISIALETAPFAVSDAFVSQEMFNPENPGLFGILTIGFYADNRGSGRVDILDPAGEAIRSLDTGQFTQRYQTVTWDGRDREGRPVPEGIYTINIRAKGADGTFSETSTSLTVDRSAIIRPRVFTGGFPGFLYCPTPDILPRDRIQISTAALGAFRNSRAFVPFQAGLRFSPTHSVECVLQGTLLAVSGEDDGYSLGAAVTFPLETPAPEIFSLALGGKAACQGVRYTDTLTNFTGISVSVPAGLSLGPLKLYLAPEAVVSYNRVEYGATDAQSPAFYLWGYARAALAVEIPGFSLGFSAALRTVPFVEGLAIDLPMEIGWEVHFIIPRTQFFGSIYTACEIEDMDNYYFLYGAGIDFLY